MFVFNIENGWEIIPSPRAGALHLQPGVVHRRRLRSGDGGGADVTDDVQRFFQSEVHPQHLISTLSLFCRLLHECVLISARVQLSQQLGVDELFRLDGESTLNTALKNMDVSNNINKGYVGQTQLLVDLLKESVTVE